MGKLASNMRPLPVWCLPPEFETAQGEQKRFIMEYAPIGIQFSKRAPFTVSSVKQGSYGQQLGIQQGWLVTGIGDADVRRETQRATLYHHMKSGSEILPIHDSAHS